MIAADLMTTEPTSLRCDDEVTTAVSLMHRLGIHHLPVLDERDQLIGMLSDSDLNSLLLPHVLRQEGQASAAARARAPVSMLLRGEPVCVSMEDDASTVVQRMTQHGVSAVPVVDAAGKLVGIVSFLDLLRHYVEEERRWASARRASEQRLDLVRKADPRAHRLATDPSQRGA